MSDETEAQPEAGEGRARRARKPKAAAAEARPVEVEGEEVGAAPALDLAPFRAYVARVPGWGPLHCVLHDGSVDDDAVLRAQQDARALRDAEALALAELLGALDEAGRLAVREALHSP